MEKYFNTEGSCNHTDHYMVNLDTRLASIKNLVDKGKYFTINRARQYGKTTTLHALEEYLQDDYLVISLDFQMMSNSDFENENVFVEAFVREIPDGILNIEEVPEDILNALQSFSENDTPKRLSVLFRFLSNWCQQSTKKIVLIIDEVDSASNNQIFLDFLAQLRGFYIKRERKATFHCVILAGVYDIRNLKQKIRPNDVSKKNSPWNIATDFNIDMSFSANEITGMLKEYETDHHTEMDIEEMADLLYDYTSGYPFLVSRLCKLMDEVVSKMADYPNMNSVWTKNGFLQAVKLILNEKNTLFDSLINKLSDFEDMRKMVYSLLFTGRNISYNPDNPSIELALMFGFVKVQEDCVMISNRIFEVRLYNFFISEEQLNNSLYDSALQDKNQFIENGHLNMELVLEKFVYHFTDLYADSDEKFVEDVGRRYFLLFLEPIINGVGNYYIEAQTRGLRRTDIIVDYRGEQFIIEMKIWHGDEYNQRGEKQLSDYLDYYHLQKGYLLSFNFNKNKQTGIKHIKTGEKELIEAIV